MRLPLLTCTALAAASALLAGCFPRATGVPRPVIVSPPSSEFAGGRSTQAMDRVPAGAAVMAAPGAVQATDDWRRIVSTADMQRLMSLDEAWANALTAARRNNAADVDRLGVLLQPSAPRDGGAAGPALASPQPTPGDYRCRTIKLGGDKGLPFVAYGWFRCRIELSPGGDLTFTKLTGSQRQQGRLYPWTDRALAFVGAEAWGNETTYPAYGQNPERDEVGALERIGPDRWRLLLAWPKQESVLDVIELVRAS
jgi:hypothetical protein